MRSLTAALFLHQAVPGPLAGPFEAFDFPLDRRRYPVLGYIHVGEADAQRTGDIGCRPFLLDEQIKNLKLLKAEAPSNPVQRRRQQILAPLGFEQRIQILPVRVRNTVNRCRA